MRVGRRVVLGVAVVGVAAAAGGWWWTHRVAVPSPPAVVVTPAADPAFVADIAAARAAVEAAPRSAVAWGEYGLVLRAYEQHPEADLCFETAAALDPDDGRWAYLRGVRLADGDPAAAAAWLQQAVGRVPAAAAEAVKLKLVETLLAADRIDEARAALGPDAPASPRGQLAAARLAVAAGDDRRAAELLAELAAGPLPSRPVFTLQAQLYQRQNRPASAAEASKKAAAAPDPPWPDPLADPILRRNRSRPGLLDEAARLLREGRPLDAEKLLRPLTANSPDAKPFLGLAEARAAVGDPAGAARALADGEKADPKDAAVHYQLGLARFAAGEGLWAAGRPDPARAAFQEAVARFDAALALNPTFGKAILLKGVALQRFLGRPDEGVALIRRFIELRPEVGEGHLLLGEALAAGGQLLAARAALERAADLAPANDRRAADALAGLGRSPTAP